MYSRARGRVRRGDYAGACTHGPKVRRRPPPSPHPRRLSLLVFPTRVSFFEGVDVLSSQTLSPVLAGDVPLTMRVAEPSTSSSSPADSSVGAAVAIPPRVGASLDRPEVSVVMPCLNEADTVATCVGKALRALEAAGIDGEVIVADNGSTDGSQAIARSLGARVVDVKAKGYGNALMGGIAAARGEYVVMGDADDSYNFLELPKFVAKLREGFDLVQGCRLPRGGGRIEPGAMPFL